MTPYQNIYYVYLHIDPITGTPVYVGKGSRGRAWHCAESNSRGKEHASWMNELILKGYTPDSWVAIDSYGLSQKDAHSREVELIWSLRPYPIFNDKKAHCCTLDNEVRKEILSLRESGLSYDLIGKKVGSSTMTIYRFLNGQTKNYN